MDFQTFVREAGLKVLAVAHLDQCQYSVVMYLLNCAVSGLDQFVTNEAELASLIGYNEETVREALQGLATRQFVKLHYGDAGDGQNGNQSLRIGMHFNIRDWDVAMSNAGGSSHDAVRFMTYYMVHDGHHRGQILLQARLLGHPVSMETMSGLWQWAARARE